MAQLKVVSFLITKLWQPFADSVKGKISWKEAVSAILLVILYVIFGGELTELVKHLFVTVDWTTFDAQAVVDALVIFVVALLHKKAQGK